MNTFVVATLLFLTLGHSVAFECDLAEKCTDGNLLASSTTTESYQECLSQCKKMEKCGFVTFFDQFKLCEFFENCQETEVCDSCTSGEVQCPSFSCDLHGHCLV